MHYTVKKILDSFYRDMSYNREVHYHYLLHIVSTDDLKFPGV